MCYMTHKIFSVLSFMHMICKLKKNCVLLFSYSFYNKGLNRDTKNRILFIIIIIIYFTFFFFYIY